LRGRPDSGVRARKNPADSDATGDETTSNIHRNQRMAAPPRSEAAIGRIKCNVQEFLACILLWYRRAWRLGVLR